MPEPESLPEDQRPTFVLLVPRYGTVQKLRELLGSFDKIEVPDAPDTDDETAIASHQAKTRAATERANRMYDEIYSLVHEHLVGWRNVTTVRGEDMPYDRDRLDEAVSEMDVIVLGEVLRNGAMISMSEKKDSESPSPSHTEAHAEGAPVGANGDALASVRLPSSAPDATVREPTPETEASNSSNARIAEASGESKSKSVW